MYHHSLYFVLTNNVFLKKILYPSRTQYSPDPKRKTFFANKRADKRTFIFFSGASYSLENDTIVYLVSENYGKRCLTYNKSTDTGRVSKKWDQFGDSLHAVSKLMFLGLLLFGFRVPARSANFKLACSTTESVWWKRKIVFLFNLSHI